MSPVRRGRDDFSFDARYGRLIRKAGIGTIPFALFFYQAELELAPQEVWLVGYVLSHRWTSDLPYPAVREMARRSGVTTKTIEKYKKALEHKGYLAVVRRTRADGGNTSIGWDFSALFERIDRLITRDIDQWVRRNPQFLEEEIAFDQDAPDGPVDDPVDNWPPARPGSSTPVGRGYHGAGGSIYHGPGGRPSHGPATTGRTLLEEESHDEENDRNDAPRPVTSRLTQSRSARRSISKPEVSSARPLDREDGDAPLPPSPLIDRIVQDYSARLHDAPKSVRANCTRVRRLWTRSGLPEDEFVALLHRSYHRTQENSHRIRKSAAAGPYGTKNKMPYFFTVLARLVETGGDD